MNLSRYVENSPTNATDPTGLESWWDPITQYGSDYWHYLTNPSDMDDDLVVANNVAYGMVGVGVGGLAGVGAGAVVGVVGVAAGSGATATTIAGGLAGGLVGSKVGGAIGGIGGDIGGTIGSVGGGLAGGYGGANAAAGVGRLNSSLDDMFDTDFGDFTPTPYDNPGKPAPWYVDAPATVGGDGASLPPQWPGTLGPPPLN